MEIYHRNVWNASDCFSTILHESSFSFYSGIRDSTKTGSLWQGMKGVGGVRKSIHQCWLAKKVRVKVTMLRFLGSSGRDSIGRGQHSSNRVSAISSRTMHQSTTPSMSQTIWPRWASRQFLSLPIVQTLLPVTFGYSLRSEAVVMRQPRRWKRLWRRSLTRSHKRTFIGSSWSCWNDTSAMQPEEITSKGTRVSRVYYQWKCPYEKSLETYRMHLVLWPLEFRQGSSHFYIAIASIKSFDLLFSILGFYPFLGKECSSALLVGEDLSCKG